MKKIKKNVLKKFSTNYCVVADILGSGCLGGGGGGGVTFEQNMK